VAGACSYAVEEGWLARPPAWRRVRPRPGPPTLNRPRSYDEVARLLDRLHEGRDSSWESRRLCALTWTVALTGVRLGEALHSWVEELADGTLHVNPARHRLKTARSDRRVPLPEVLTRVLADWLPHDD